MKCLRKYKWLKLHRSCMPAGKGIMGYWAKLASRAAFRKGIGLYCGHRNPVTAGMWTGGIVGLKSILGVKRRNQALWIMHELEELGYIVFSHDTKTKKISYEIKDWVMTCIGSECETGSVYATDGYGFLCLPRSITERLAERKKVFDEADAWLDLWSHTIYRDYGNAFSFLGPAVQFGKYGSVLTLDGLGKRWGWEKTKVWRFFQKNADDFALFKLPSCYGCVIYNKQYFREGEVLPPDESDVIQMLSDIKAHSRIGIPVINENERINRMVAWNSRKTVKALEEASENESGEERVAVVSCYTRAYFSHGRNCKYSRNSIYDCRGMFLGERTFESELLIGILCPFLDSIQEPPDFFADYSFF